MRASRQEDGLGWSVAQAAGMPGLWRLRAGHARGAHPKHVLHVCDAGRVEAQRLVERRRALPSRKRKHRRRGDMRASRREGGGVGWLVLQGGLGLYRLKAGHARGAHVKHGLHVTDAGRVKAQRLVECVRILPSGKGEASGEGAACGAREAGGGGGGASNVQGGCQLRRLAGQRGHARSAR